MRTWRGVDVIETTMRLVRDRFIEPERIDARAMGRAAAHRIEALAGPVAVPEGLELDAAASLETLAEVMTRLVDRAVAAGVCRPAATAAALDAALRTLDRWSTAVHDAGRRRATARYGGTLVGIGAMLGRRDGVVKIVEVYEDGAAAEAGLRVGETVVAVDDAATDGWTVGRVLAVLGGAAGTSVRLRVRDGAGQRVVDVVRRPFAANRPSARRLEGDVGVLRIAHFSRHVDRLVGSALDALGPIGGLVIDLRGCAGGSMLACAEVADRFVPRGVLVGAVGRGGASVADLRPEVRATGRGRLCPDLAIAVDRRTASCAELLAATLSRHGRATIVGERTFGKSTIQKLYDFPEHDVLVKLSTARMLAAGATLGTGGTEPGVPARSHDAVERAAAVLAGDVLT